MISFDTIAAGLLLPGHYIEFDNTLAVKGLPGMPFKILVIGQRLTTGTVAAGVVTQIADPEEARLAFGNGSNLHHLIDAARRNNKYTDLWAIAVADNPAGVAASGTVTVTGTATASGTLVLYIAGRRITVGVTNGDLQNAIATNLNAAINADAALPVTSTVATNIVTVTARHKGEIGNDIDLRVNLRDGEVLPAGVSVVVVAMASGLTNPTLTSTIAALGDEWYQVIVHPWTDSASLAVIEAELNDRWTGMSTNDGQAFTGKRGTYSALTAFGAGRNNPHMTIIGANGSPTPLYEWGAALGAVCAFYLQADPARPVQTLPLIGILPPTVASTNRFIDPERNILLGKGISTYRVDLDGTVRIERAVTTYQTNPAGAVDPSYRDVETMFTASRLRFDLRTRLGLRYPRSGLADDGTRYAPGKVIVTPKSMKAEIIALYGEWEKIGLVENVEAFKVGLIVERNADDPNRMDLLLPPDFVNQLRLTASKIQFRI